MNPQTPTPPPSSPPDLYLQIVSNPALICGVRELTCHIARRVGFTGPDCSRIGLAIDEALTNIIRHGYDKAPGRPIWMRVWMIEGAPNVLRIILEDEARQVDPAQIKSRDLADIRPGGLGVHIIKEIMDEAVYQKREGPAGMCLSMLKRVVPAPDGAATADKNSPCGGCDGRA